MTYEAKQYFIYISGTEDEDYFSLLRDVVSPISNTLDALGWFFFFRYQDETGHYIRLRICTDSIRHQEIKDILDTAIANNFIIKYDASDYDLIEDISQRFGICRYDKVVIMCQTASLLALEYADGIGAYDPHPKGHGGVAGIVHLISNTLNYKVKLNPAEIYEVQDWDRVSKRYGSVCP